MNMLCPKYEVKDLEIFDVIFPVWLKLFCLQVARACNAFVSFESTSSAIADKTRHIVIRELPILKCS